MQGLRSKFVLSHIIPTLLLLPLLSVYLLYTLEDFYTASLLHQLVNQSRLLRDEVERDPELIENTQVAQKLLSTIAALTDSRVVVLNREGIILASSREEDDVRIGSRHEHPSVAQALRGEMATGVGPGFTADVAYVVLPLWQNGQITGALRLSYEVTDVHTQFDELRWLVLGGFALTVILSLALALGLATTITRPLRQLNEGAHRIASGNYRARVVVRGRDEVSELARSFNRMAERLQEAEQARERQLAAIVHELARPLAGIRAAVETLRDGADTDREMRDTLLAGAEEELARLERLIGTLSNLHQRALRPIQLNRTEIGLERVIRACVANFEPMAARQKITLTAEIPNNLPRLRADEDRLIQVLTNLLDNAFKFTPRGGSITIRVSEDDQNVYIAVMDTGMGISPEELPHIFQQFYSGDKSRPPEKRGMGLGLTICREIIMAHQGQIRVESQPGTGARFTFSLPKK